MNKQLCLLTALITLLCISNSHAALSPIGIGIVPPIQFPTEDVTVGGVRLSALWSNHRSMNGIDLGVVGNMSSISFTGLSVAGLFNWNKGSVTILGLQAAGITNINVNKTTITGLQIAGGVNSNVAASTHVGLQLALIANLSPFTDVYGGQVGFYNSARDVYGIQIGVINVADKLHGLQIGLVNFHKMGLFAICPIINFGF